MRAFLMLGLTAAALAVAACDNDDRYDDQTTVHNAGDNGVELPCGRAGEQPCK